MQLNSINPSTGEIISSFTCSTPRDIDTSLISARVAQDAWQQTTYSQRIKPFTNLKKLIESQVNSLAEIMLLETGKRIPDSEAEIFDVIDAIDYYSQKLQSLPPFEALQINNDVFPNTTVKISYQAIGVVGLIMPWNFSFYSPLMFIIANLMAGNAILFKPSKLSTLVGQKIAELIKASGFPEGIFHLILGGEEVGQSLVKSGLDKIFFVGSVEAGKDIVKNAGLTPVQVELGGNSAAIVLKDADLEMTTQAIAWGGTYHAGQDCVGVKRIFVDKHVAEEFITKLTQIVTSLRPGLDYGPYISAAARAVTQDRISQAIEKGALVVLNAEELAPAGQQGYWLSPSILLLNNQESDLTKLETFGNVLPIQIVENVQEAINLTNQSNYGLSASIYTSDTNKAEALAAKIQTGMVFINEPFIAMPGWDHWTGWKQSGFGSTEGKFMQCLKKKIVSVNQSKDKRSFWYPY